MLGIILAADGRELGRAKRQTSFLLPTDTEKFLSRPIKPQFRCLKTGYYADIDNNCQMYHVCVVQTKATGHKVTRQFSFVCGNNTIFNQLTQTCDNPEESLPCIDAPKFYGLNTRIGQTDAVMHTGNDYKENIEREEAPEDEYFSREDPLEPAADTIHLSAEKPGLYFYERQKKAKSIIFRG